MSKSTKAELKKLDEKWDKTMDNIFKKFIKKNVGYSKDLNKPVCFGTGDDRPYCPYCYLKNEC